MMQDSNGACPLIAIDSNVDGESFHLMNMSIFSRLVVLDALLIAPLAVATSLAFLSFLRVGFDDRAALLFETWVSK
ncbi:hypothetical protein Tco_1052573 [Tanacetum coccineum]